MHSHLPWKARIPKQRGFDVVYGDTVHKQNHKQGVYLQQTASFPVQKQKTKYIRKQKHYWSTGC